MTWVYIEKNQSSYEVKSDSQLPQYSINAKLANNKALDLINHIKSINKGSLTSGDLTKLTNAMDLAHILILSGL